MHIGYDLSTSKYCSKTTWKSSDRYMGNLLYKNIVEFADYNLIWFSYNF